MDFPKVLQESINQQIGEMPRAVQAYIERAKPPKETTMDAEFREQLMKRTTEINQYLLGRGYDPEKAGPLVQILLSPGVPKDIGPKEMPNTTINLELRAATLKKLRARALGLG